MRVQRRDQRGDKQEQTQRAEGTDTVEGPHPHRGAEGNMLEKFHQHERGADQHQIQAQQPQPALADIPEDGHAQQRQDARDSRYREREGQEPVLPVLQADIQQESRQAAQQNQQDGAGTVMELCM